VAAISGVYDISLGATMLAGRGLLAGLFAVPPPQPPIHADLNGLFLIAIGLGYVMPWRDPERYRNYLWVMGPVLKGAGAVAFILDYLVRGSPSAFLIFAVTDGTLAIVTLLALVSARAARGSGSKGTIDQGANCQAVSSELAP
jgi:hypothetical protein